MAQFWLQSTKFKKSAVMRLGDWTLPKPLLALQFSILGFDPEHVQHKWVTVEEAEKRHRMEASACEREGERERDPHIFGLIKEHHSVGSSS